MPFFKKSLFQIFILLAAINCTNEIGDESLFIAEAPVQSATIAANADLSVTFNARTVWFTDCGKFHHFVMDSTGRNVFIKVFGSQLKNAYCNEDFATFNSPITVDTDSSGEYLFRFWINDDNTYDLVVNVNN